MKRRLKESVSIVLGKSGASPKVLETISVGYKIPFFEISQSSSFKNNKSGMDNSAFVSPSLQELICTESIAEVPFIPN